MKQKKGKKQLRSSMEPGIVSIVDTSKIPDCDLPLVSIIIPSFNRPNKLKAAIKSIFAQTYSCYEIIVVDNGSNSNTLASITPFLEKNSIKLLSRQKPAKSPATLYNMGIDVASGDMLTFLDDDNLWHPERLWIGVYAILSGNVDCVYTSMELSFEGKGEYKSDEPIFPSKETILVGKPPRLTTIATAPHQDPIQLEAIHVNDLIFKQYIVEKIGVFDEILQSSIGIEYVIRLNKSGYACKYLPAPAVIYRVWGGQRSAQKEYALHDVRHSRAYILGKERTMRKQLKIFVIPGEADPYITKAIKHIPWVSVVHIPQNFPMWVLEHRVAKEMPNFVIHADLLVASDIEQKTLNKLPVLTCGLVCGVRNDELSPKQMAALVSGNYPHINWIITDNQDIGSCRPCVIIADPPSEEEAVGFWESTLNIMRCNRYFA